MPKLKPSKTELQDRTLVGSMENQMRIQGIDKKGTAKQAGFAESTFYQRLRNPDTFTIRELRRVFAVLHYPDEEKERVGKECI